MLSAFSLFLAITGPRAQTAPGPNVGPNLRDDIAAAAAALPAAIEAYRREGLPWTAADLQPKPPIPDAENAAPPLRQAVDAIDWREWGVDSMAVAVRAGFDEDVQEVVSSYRPMLNLLYRAVQKPRYWYWRDYDQGPALLLPEYPEFKLMIRALVFTAEFDALHGKVEESVRELETARRLSNLFARESGPLVGALVQFACAAIVFAAEERILAIPSLQHADRAKLAEECMKPTDVSHIASCLSVEAFFPILLLRRSRPIDPRHATEAEWNRFMGADTDGHIVGDPTLYWKPAAASALVPDDLASRASLTRILQFWTETARRARVLPNIRELTKEMDARIAAIVPGEPGSGGPGQANPGQGAPRAVGASYLFLFRVAPIFRNSGEAEMRTVAAERCARALAFALAERDRTGKFPLDAERYPTPMQDPFGGTLKIKLTADGVRIYSVGPDGVDNGGIARRELADKSAESGYDIVASYPPLTHLFQIAR
jgi:hypothetical protein